MTVTPMHSHKARRGSSGNEPQLPQEQIEGIRSRLQKHLDDNADISQAKVAKTMGWSSSSLSYFIKGQYTGDASALARDLKRYLDTFDRRRTATGDLEFVRTSIVKRIEQTIVIAEATRKIAVIATDAGVGATDTLRWYRDMNRGVVLLECDPSTNTPWALLTALSAVVLEDGYRFRPADATLAIIKALTNTNGTILVDEAHYLTNPKCIDLLRRISDRAGVALVLVGNSSTYQGRGVGNSMLSSTAYTQFQRRTVRRLRIRASEITANDLRLVIGQLVDDTVLAAVQQRLLTEAHNNGGIGRVVPIVQSARVLARSKEITPAHVLRAIQLANENGDEGEE